MGCPQSHTGQGFSSCVFSCQRAKTSIFLGHFSFQFELWFFLIWSWSIPVGASETRCSTRVFSVSKTAAADHSRHESTKCEQDSKSGSCTSGSWVRIPPYPPKKASACADAFLTKQIPAGSVKCTSCVKFALRRVNCLWAWADLLCFTWRKAQIRSLGSLPLYMTNQGVVESGAAVSEQLATKGISSSELDLVLLSHLDCDHANGQRDVAAAK